jgi:hypothetical protein
MIRFILAAILALALPARAQGPAIPAFVEETGTAGIASVYAGDWEYMVGGGAATFDCSDDGFPDLFLAGGSGPATFYRNASAQGGTLAFTGQNSGLEQTGVTGAYPLDIDSDGKQDLVLLRVGENVVMRGLGACKFERANEAWGFDGGDAWTAAMAATWEHGQTWPTIAIGNYIDRNEDAFPWGSCTDNWLHRPAASGTGFAPPLPLTPSYCALSMLFTDWNRSGTPSLRVSNDREYYKGGQEQMWRVDPGQPPALYTEAEGWKFLRIWGMGIASTDVNADGYPDFFLTSMADNKLQTLVPPAEGADARPSYTDIAFARGVTAHRPYTGGEVKPSTAWHAQFEDVNNDGRADLFIAKGNVAEMPDFAIKDPNNLVLQDAEGQFHEAGDTAGIASMKTARGAAMADFNLDGLVDLVVVNRWESAQLWRNSGGGDGHWLGLALRQPAPNRDAIGAWIEVRSGGNIQRREITVGGGHAGGQSGWWHFGLGGESAAEVRVIWPDGTEGEWQGVQADHFYRLRPEATPEVWSPG